MKYTLFATTENNDNLSISSDVDTLKFLVQTHPDCQRFLASKIVNNSNYILSRAPSVSPDLHEVQLTIVSDADPAQLERNVRIWAQRSRVAGVSGYRLALVGDLTEVEEGVYSVLVLLSTTVCYNHRRATVNFGSSSSDVEADLAQLMPHIDGSVSATSSLHPGSVFGDVLTDSDLGCATCALEYRTDLLRSIRWTASGLDTNVDPETLLDLARQLQDQVGELLADLED